MKLFNKNRTDITDLVSALNSFPGLIVSQLALRFSRALRLEVMYSNKRSMLFEDAYRDDVMSVVTNSINSFIMSKSSGPRYENETAQSLTNEMFHYVSLNV